MFYSMEGDRLTLLGRSLKNNKRRLLLYCLYIVLFVPRVQLSFIEVDHETDRHMLVLIKEEMETK